MKTYDLFTNGRWVGMAEGIDKCAARKMVKDSLPHLGERFTLIEWHGKFHPDNCKTSGGNKPDPTPELEWTLLNILMKTRAIITEAALTGFNHNDGDWAERLFYNQSSLSDAIKSLGGK